MDEKDNFRDENCSVGVVCKLGFVFLAVGVSLCLRGVRDGAGVGGLWRQGGVWACCEMCCRYMWTPSLWGMIRGVVEWRFRRWKMRILPLK